MFQSESRRGTVGKLSIAGGCLFYLFFCFFSHTGFAKDINFEIEVESARISLGDTTTLNLTFNDTQNIPVFNVPLIDGLGVRYQGPATRVSIVNGQMSSSITHIYSLFPAKAGRYTLGPWKFDYHGDTYTSGTVILEVVQGQVQKNTPSGSSEQDILSDVNDKVFLVIQPKKNKLYINEVAALTIKLYVREVGVTDIQFPTLTHDGFFVSEFQQPRQYQEVLGDIQYEVIELNAAFFGLKPQEARLGPAQLQCNLIIRKQRRRDGFTNFDDFFDSSVIDDFFGSYRKQPIILKSADIPITVTNLPEEGKPENYSGAVGNFDFDVSASPQEVKVGDPITLKGMIRGNGNLNTVTVPQCKAQDNLKVYEPQVKQEKESKSFTQVIIPLDEKIRELPLLTFHFFNPETARYESITKGPFPLKVTKLDKQEELKVVEALQQLNATSRSVEKLGRDIVYIKTSMGKVMKKGSFLYKNKLFLTAQFAPFLCFILFSVWRARNRKLRTDIRYARALSAPRKAREGIRKAEQLLAKTDKIGYFDAVFQTLQEYLGDYFHLPSQGITISVIDEISRHQSIPQDILDKLRDIFKECDIARYAASSMENLTMQAVLKELEEVIEYLQKHKISA